jgi:rubrerythrin
MAFDMQEEAVRTYTHAIEEIDNGQLPLWKTMPAPDIAKQYWKLGQNATVRDLLLAVRADEAIHRDVNHTLCDLPDGVKNPFV